MLRKNVTRLLMSSHPPCQYIYNEDLNVQQRNVNRKISWAESRGEGGWSHLFCFAVRQEVPEDWRLEISEYNNAVIMVDIDIKPFIQWQCWGGGIDIFILGFFYYIMHSIVQCNAKCLFIVLSLLLRFLSSSRETVSRGSSGEIDWVFLA